MSQFDSPTEASLTQIKIQAESSTLVGRAMAGIGTTIVKLATGAGASSLVDLVTGLKDAAVNKDMSNLIYFAEALLDDIRRLYRLSDEQRQRTDQLLSSDSFQETIANATLHITRTNMKTRLKRLARVLTNSVRDEDLEPESVDDMMWCAVTLTERDVEVLGIVYDMQRDLLSPQNLETQRGQRTNHLQRKWQDWWRAHLQSYRGVSGLEFQNSVARLQAAGLVGLIPKSVAESPVQNDMELLIFGHRFYKRLRQIGAEESSD